MLPADPTQFRVLLSRFPTGVTVATTIDPNGQPIGMTASSVAAVSLAPPLLLICVGVAADFHAALSRADRFALNILAHDQDALSRRFADSNLDRFENVPLVSRAGEPPLIDGVVAHISCRKWASHDAGDHTIFIGQVTAGAVFDRQPLVHYRSEYTNLAPP